MLRGILALSILLVGCLLSGHVLAAPVTAPSSGALAGEPTTVVSLDSPGFDDIDPYGVKLRLMKKALRTLASILRSSKLDTMLKWLARETDSRIVGVVRKHARKIADKLDDLCKWEDLTMNAVKDQIFVTLRDAGVAETTATEAAFWIKNFIEWTLL